MQAVTNRAVIQTEDDRAVYRLGLLALRDGHIDAAIPLLTAAAGAHPADAGMQRTLVRALLAAGQFAPLPRAVARALATAPDDPDLHFALGTALNGLGQPAKACTAFSRAVAIQPDHAASWLNFANAAIDMDDVTAAEAMYRTAVRLDPDLPEAHASLGYALTRLGHLDDAMTCCETAIRLRPDFARAHLNLATATLLSGDLRRGFAEYAWRKRVEQYRRDFPDLHGPAWDGSDPRGRRILVRAEQGFGDIIQCARYLRMIREAGGTPILAGPKNLLPLIRSMAGVEAARADAPLPPYDAGVDLMDLPGVFGTTLNTIPLPGGYLSADASLVRAWSARLPPGRKIGLVLSGNPRHQADRRRSIAAELVRPLPVIPGMSFVSLHHGPADDGLGLPNLTPWMTDYAQTAALVENLDLVVTVDTSIAHLAGALGKPALVLLPFAPDWRWMLGRSDSPWYRSVRLVRQTRAGDWSSPLAEVMGTLAS
jgi:tetratricopeptide (TPR) repeat protein